jgi:RND superfamily putative drug exporter
MSADSSREGRSERSFAARIINRLSLPILLGWLAVVGVLFSFVPPLERFGAERSTSMNRRDAPALIAVKHIGLVFQESSSDSMAMILLEGEKSLDGVAHNYYDDLIRKLKADPHVQHVQDFWGDSLTAAAAQSSDGKSAYVQVNLAGDQGETLANESVDAVRGIVAHTPPRRG